MKSARSSSQSEYDGIWANAWKICDLKSSAIRSRHSIGPWMSAGTWCLVPTMTGALIRRDARIVAAAPSTAAGTAAPTPSCAGSGRPDPGRAGTTARSTRCGAGRARTAAPRSARRRSRGGGGTSPRPAGAGTGAARGGRRRTLRRGRSAAPRRAARERRISRPSRNESSPKSSSPVRSTAAAISSSGDATVHLPMQFGDSTLSLL